VTERVLFVVLARGGSRRIPGKNLLEVGGIPLVGHAVRVGRLSADRLAGGPHHIVCSTDDDAIARVASAWGASVLERPAELAGDDVLSVDAVRHALIASESAGPFRTVVLLQPTTPLTDPDDVVAAVETHRRTGDGVVGVTQSHPVWWHARADRDGEPFRTIADDADPDTLLLSGSVYVASAAVIADGRPLVEPGVTRMRIVAHERSVDIDEPVDMAVASALLDARPLRTVSIGDRMLGDGRAFVIAEAGVNHDGDPEVAHRLVDAAVAVGADAVKFQTFETDRLVSPGAPRARYQQDAADETDQAALLRGLALPASAWPALQAHATERGIVFLSTPFDDASADLLDGLGVPAFKVGSGDLTDLPFLARLARRGRPMIVSTGMADMVEVAAAVDTIRAAGDPPLALLQCVSSYPADPADADLRAIETMRRAFAVPVGWSDHTLGIETALAAVTLGAAIVEKHLTLDRGRPGPDHRASLEPDAFRSMVDGIRIVESAVGDGRKQRTAAEADTAAVARRSLRWLSDLPAGTVVEADHLVALRPADGLPPSTWTRLVGRATRQAVRGGSLVRLDDVDDAGR
jgi:N-acetylneuraminate synthase/N,N'-diacetyllegionaminate synthase